MDGVCTNCGLCVYIQEQSSKREVDDLKEQLQSSEALVADLRNTLQQRDSELETQRAKVRNDATHNYNHGILPCVMNSNYSAMNYYFAACLIQS